MGQGPGEYTHRSDRPITPDHYIVCSRSFFDCRMSDAFLLGIGRGAKLRCLWGECEIAPPSLLFYKRIYIWLYTYDYICTFEFVFCIDMYCIMCFVETWLFDLWPFVAWIVNWKKVSLALQCSYLYPASLHSAWVFPSYFTSTLSCLSSQSPFC